MPCLACSGAADVTLLEVGIGGALPYFPEWRSNETVMSKILAGNRAPQPANGCSDALYNVMLQCWDRTASSRPSFEQLVVMLERLVVEEAAASNAEIDGAEAACVLVAGSDAYATRTGMKAHSPNPSAPRIGPDGLPLHDYADVMSSGSAAREMAASSEIQTEAPASVGFQAASITPYGRGIKQDTAYGHSYPAAHFSAAIDGNYGKPPRALTDAPLRPTMYEMRARAEASAAAAGGVHETIVDSIARAPAVQTFEVAGGKGEKEKKKEKEKGKAKGPKAKKPKKEKKRKPDRRDVTQRRGSSAVLILDDDDVEYSRAFEI